MKKVLYTAVILCLVATAVSCKSTKAKKSSAKKAKAPAATEVVAEENKEAGEASGTSEEGTAAENAGAAGAGTSKDAASSGKTEEEKAAAAAAKEKEASETAAKDFTGWIKTSKKNLNERFGRIQIKTKSGIGSYTIAVLNEKDKPLPVLSTANEYVSNTFYLKTSKKVYNLVTDSSVRSAARKTTSGAMILYEIPSVAQMSVDLSCFSSEKKNEADMIKVTATVKNTSNRNEDYTIKAVLDTVLGEAAAFHFYNWEDIPVKSEVLYRTLQNQKWFVSKNINAAMQLFFTGADCTAPDLVALANYSTLEKNSWEPDMLSYRVFDTVLSYNNSAVCAIWKPLRLAPLEAGKIVFYIALSGDGTPARGEKYIYSKEFAAAEEAAPVDSKNSANSLTVITPYSVEEGVVNISEAPGVTEINSDFAPASQTPAEVPNVDFYIKNMTKEHLTPEYIQSLLDRIAALEEDSPSLNRQELLQLNAELDAILTYLRQ